MVAMTHFAVAAFQYNLIGKCLKMIQNKAQIRTGNPQLDSLVLYHIKISSCSLYFLTVLHLLNKTIIYTTASGYEKTSAEVNRTSE